MKKQNLFPIVAAATALVFAACQQVNIQNEKPQEPVITNLGEEEIVVEAQGGEALVSFKADAAWTASSSEEWLFIGQESGEAGFYDVDVYVDANETGDARSAVITVSLDEKTSFSVLVSQLQNNVFGVDTTPLSIGSEGGQLTFTVTGNIDYTVSPLADWITVVSTKGVVDNTVTLSIAENEGEERSSAVKVGSSEGDVIVKITQECGVTDFIYGIEAGYHGDYYGVGTANWVLSVYNMDFIEGGDAPKIYDFDLCLPIEYDFFKVEAEGLPEGDYVFNDSCAAFTINSNSQIEDYVDYEYIDLENVEMSVKDGVLSFAITDVNGNVHKVKWVIEADMFFVSDNTYSSTVTADYELTFNECVIEPYGQYFLNAGYETYQTVLSFNGATSQLGVNEEAEETEGLLLLSSATEDFTGSYTVEPINQQNFTAGTVDAYNSSFYSYYGYYYVSDGYFKPNGGTLTVTKDGDNYIVEGVLTDDYPYGEPHKLTIHAVGQIASEEETETSSASSKKAVMHKTLSERRTLSAPRKAHNDYRITL